MIEHNPTTCDVCEGLSDWADAPDIEAWLKAHAERGIALSVVGTPANSRVVEQEPY